MLAKIIDNNTIEVYDLTQFDTHAIMHSGQVFRYFPQDEGYQIVTGKNYAKIQNDGNKAIITCNDSKYFWNYFDLDTDYNEIKNQLYKYESIRPAIEAGGGIRILRADFAEVVVSFIISANNNIKRFTKTLNGLAEKFGDKLPNGMYSFPTLNQLSLATQADFKTLGCGYRAPYLEKAICQLQNLDTNTLKILPATQNQSINTLKTLPAHQSSKSFIQLQTLDTTTLKTLPTLQNQSTSTLKTLPTSQSNKSILQLQNLSTNTLKTLPTPQLDKALQQICGVGPKVSACIMLFCGEFHRLDTAPVDTWINKAINQLNSAEKSALFTHKYAGVAQQYIFYYLQHLHQSL